MICNKKDEGFTIMELMIAISVLAVILLICAFVLTGIGRLMDKGVNMSDAQDTTRNIINDISNTAKFSTYQMYQNSQPYYVTSSNTTISFHSICMGNIRYSYYVGFPQNVSLKYVIYKDQMDSPASNQTSCVPLDLTKSTPICPAVSTGCYASIAGSGVDLAGNNMHIGLLTVNYQQSIYYIKLEILIGTKDLFSINNNGEYVCNDNTGQAFCGTSILSTVASQRLQYE